MKKSSKQVHFQEQNSPRQSISQRGKVDEGGANEKSTFQSNRDNLRTTPVFVESSKETMKITQPKTMSQIEQEDSGNFIHQNQNS